MARASGLKQIAGKKLSWSWSSGPQITNPQIVTIGPLIDKVMLKYNN
jgi:hypothetical protein